MRGVVVPLGNANWVAYVTPFAAVSSVMRKGDREKGDNLLRGAPDIISFRWEREGAPLSVRDSVWRPLSADEKEGVLTAHGGQLLRIRIGWRTANELRMAWRVVDPDGGVHTLTWEVNSPSNFPARWGNGALWAGPWRVGLRWEDVSAGVWDIQTLARQKTPSDPRGSLARALWSARVRPANSTQGAAMFSFAFHDAGRSEERGRDSIELSSAVRARMHPQGEQQLASRLALLKVPQPAREVLHWTRDWFVSHVDPNGLVVAPLAGDRLAALSAHSAALFWRDRHYALAAFLARGTLRHLAELPAWDNEALLAFAHLGRYARLGGNNTFVRALLKEALARGLFERNPAAGEQASTQEEAATAAHYSAALQAAVWCARERGELDLARQGALVMHETERLVLRYLIQYASPNILGTIPGLLDLALLQGLPLADHAVAGLLRAHAAQQPFPHNVAVEVCLGNGAQARLRFLEAILARQRENLFAFSDLIEGRWVWEIGLLAWDSISTTSPPRALSHPALSYTP
ncbi:hypothetical protein D6792_03645 [Candidatus Parcubacteria bacterium]|nr:MAG: hypothetical protein D6792_03645 [Candidatus Parcubacteria bacterium]GIW69074.1 MAG: hypothetical protein KatS3mg100_568 [Candidatus Parcubacteria bacterium]